MHRARQTVAIIDFYFFNHCILSAAADSSWNICLLRGAGLIDRKESKVLSSFPSVSTRIVHLHKDSSRVRIPTVDGTSVCVLKKNTCRGGYCDLCLTDSDLVDSVY